MDELEGIANRTDYDLKHMEHGGTEIQYFDPVERKRYTPYVIEPAAGATRGVLTYLCDAYTEEEVEGPKGTDTRVVMRFHPRLAPTKVGVFPLVKKNGMPEKAREVVEALLARGIAASYDAQHAIGKRYRRHDEIGTPWCLTIDGETMESDIISAP